MELRSEDQSFDNAIEKPHRYQKFKRGIFIIAYVYSILSISFVLLIALLSNEKIFRAVIIMGTGLVLFWIVLGGPLQWFLRDRVVKLLGKIPSLVSLIQGKQENDSVSLLENQRPKPLRFCGMILNRFPLQFVLLSTLMACLEEAVTVSMTNSAPLWGVTPDQAHITASTNYLDVVCLHSVIVFIPSFMSWAFFMSRYNFDPLVVMLMYGLLGWWNEIFFAGFTLSSVLMWGMWVLVYGLMIFLPAYAPPRNVGEVDPRWYHYILAFFSSMLAPIPVAIVVGLLHPYRTHFSDNTS